MVRISPTLWWARTYRARTLTNAIFNDAMLAPDLTNQSMGLMRGILKGANLEGASFKGANLMRSAFEYASLKGRRFRRRKS